MMEKTKLFTSKVREIITAKDYDWIHVIVGKEGTGKTSLGWNICKAVDPDFNGEKDCIFSVKEFKQKIENSSPGKAIQIDEGALVFYSRESLAIENRKAIKLMTAIRSFNLFIVICVPNFWILDKYLREHRIKTCARVVERGWYHHYSPRKVSMFKQDKYNKMKTVYPPWDFRDSYPDAAKLWPKEWEKYKLKKAKLALKVGDVAGGTEVSCHHCGYIWRYFGQKKKGQYVSCPKCYYRIFLR